MKKFFGFSLTMLLVISLFGGNMQNTNVFAKGKQQITIKVALGAPTSLPIYKAMEEVLVNEVAKNTDGHIKFELYPASQLGDDVKAIESLRSGALEMSPVATAPVVGIVKEYSIFDIPFLFNDSKTAMKILEGPVGKRLADLTAAQGIYVLGWTEMGFRHLTNSVRDIRKPEDIKGLKIRTMENPIQIATWKTMGANPTPMPVSEVFTALQQHAIDGQENPISAIFGWKFYEVNKHITLTGHVYSGEVFLFSKQIFDSYSKADQALIKKYINKTAKRTIELTAATEEEYLKQIKASGCNVITLTPAEKEAFRKATEPVEKLVSDRAGSEIMELLKSELAKVK